MRFFAQMPRRVGWTIVALLALASVALWNAALAQAPSGRLTFAVMDVGQGDSLYIEGPTGLQVVVDGGPDDSILRDLPTLMPLSDRSLDAVVETHPDADHITGFIDLLKRYEVGAFIEPGITKSTITAKTLEAEIASDKDPRIIARTGMVIDLGGGATLRVLYPDWDVSHIDQKLDNDGGIVMKLTYGSASAILMADTSSAVEDHLLAVDPEDLKSQILKVGHHGSRTSTENSFLDAVAPQVGVISVGAHNTYGHPTQDVLDRLAAHNVETLRTDQEGTIVFTSSGGAFTRSR